MNIFPFYLGGTRLIVALEQGLCHGTTRPTHKQSPFFLMVGYAALTEYSLLRVRPTQVGSMEDYAFLCITFNTYSIYNYLLRQFNV